MRNEILYIANSEKLDELVPEARYAAQCWLNDCFVLGRPFTVSEVFRTVERQKALFAQGRTKPGSIVTERDGVKNKSEHQTGLAADIYPNCSKKDQAEWWRDIADIGRKYGIEQPYTKGRFIDLPHFIFSSAKPKPAPTLPRLSENAEMKRFAQGIKRLKGNEKKRASERFLTNYGFDYTQALR